MATVYQFPPRSQKAAPATWTPAQWSAAFADLGLPPEQVRALGFPLTEETLAGMTLAGMDAVMEASRPS